METEEITLRVPKDTAESFRNAPAEEQFRIAEIVRYSMNDAAFQERTGRLAETVLEISRESGATQGDVDHILNEE